MRFPMRNCLNMYRNAKMEFLRKPGFFKENVFCNNGTLFSYVDFPSILGLCTHGESP